MVLRRSQCEGVDLESCPFLSSSDLNLVLDLFLFLFLSCCVKNYLPTILFFQEVLSHGTRKVSVDGHRILR